MLGDAMGALRQGRLQSFSVLVHRNVADGPLCVWSLSAVRPLQDRYHTLEATRPRPADIRYLVPVSDYHIAPYTGELHDRQRGERRSSALACPPAALPTALPVAYCCCSHPPAVAAAVAAELGSLRLTTSDGRHVVDPTELGSAAMLTSTKRKTANVAIEKIPGSHVAYLVPKHAIAAGTRLKCRIADFW